MTGELITRSEVIEETWRNGGDTAWPTTDMNIDARDESVFGTDFPYRSDEISDTAWPTTDTDIDTRDESILRTDFPDRYREMGDTTWRETDIDIDARDRSVLLVDVPQYTELTNETRDILRDAGYSDAVIERIGSEEEAEIYLKAGLECLPINGKDVLVRTDIDLELVDYSGMTNLERMEKGLAPLDADGKPYELHHIGQNADSPLAELTRSEHMEGGNNKILHDVTKESEINRGDFNKERAEHWKARAEEIKNQQNEVAA